VTAIGQPFEPVAPFTGTGEKMNTNWYFRSTISLFSTRISGGWVVADKNSLTIVFF
jgi:hypothetical protein